MPDDFSPHALCDESAFEPLLRLRQLAREIRAAITRNDLVIVSQAAGLLPSALARWNAVYPTLPVGAGDAAQIALETRNLLHECEVALTQAMLQVREEMRHRHKGKKLLISARSRYAPFSSGIRLDTRK
ncbi:MAG TPA: hypothetical protein VKU00_33705 [Chthonomonadaceae bacterium]|nr:hypothetical protein [Chthonomonadaceae bacterium]